MTHSQFGWKRERLEGNTQNLTPKPPPTSEKPCAWVCRSATIALLRQSVRGWGFGSIRASGGGRSRTRLLPRYQGRNNRILDFEEDGNGKTISGKKGIVSDPFGADLVVRAKATGEQITVQGHYTGRAIDVVTLADGTAWSAAQIENHLTRELTEGADYFTFIRGTAVGIRLDDEANDGCYQRAA